MPLTNHISTPDYFLLWHQDIVSMDDAKAYIDMLARNGLMYHFDDGPENVIWSLSENDHPTGADINMMRHRQDQVYAVDGWTWNDCPIGYALECLRRHGILEEAK
ncbi:MAG: hypothetical protein GOVbin4933_32 [Prokaryotic dsDNA virus sp.]|nr:MAG: hypothetical protein GOVbin4933_32 [Prokaryotic dsDNA virus sp.]|tara:strand:- start:263 stop:577 length:315 start_codon:yes stop_codon:yes gene_type:complete